MPLHASPEALRLALVSLVAATALDTRGVRLCRQMMDTAASLVSEAPSLVTRSLGAENATATRMDAIRALSGVCAACRLCPRGLAPCPDRLTGETLP